MISLQTSNILKGSPQNIRRKLLRDIILVVGVTITALLIIVLYQGSNIRKQVSATIISDTTVIVKKRFSRFIEPIETYLSIGYQWGENGILAEMDDNELTKIFIPMLATHSNISAVSIADANGNEFFLKHDGGRWLSRRSTGTTAQRIAFFQQWQDAGHLLKSWQEEIKFDPRLRPWFVEAEDKNPGQISWTDPYQFFTAGKQGVTASTSWHSPDNKVLCVMAFDILQDDLLAFLNSLQAGGQGHIIMIEKDGSIIAHNQSDRLENKNIQVPVVKAMELWHNSKKQQIEALEFSVDRQSWWAGFTALKQDDSSSWVAVIVPEREIMGNVKRQWLRVGLATAGVLFISIILALRIVSKYSYQLRDLPRQNISSQNFENELLSLIKAGESASLEFKSTMRMNLKTGKKGKEIEIAWLKTVAGFMNSDGGILLIGVEDDGNIIGIEADEFENEDKCRLHFKNLINNHIGPEFSRFIHLKIRTVQEKVILAIECERVRKPVFLSMGKTEDFYVRSGPSSLKMTMSQMVKYLEERR